MSAGLDPLGQQGDFLGFEALALGGHHLVGILRGDELEEVALEAIARDDRGLARIPAAQHRRFLIQPQSALLLLGAVALETMLGEDGLDVPVEIRRLRAPRRQRHGQNHRNDKQTEIHRGLWSINSHPGEMLRTVYRQMTGDEPANAESMTVKNVK
jgi:hypothetical protein